ncbi:MAG: type II toxin-antitoxin system VapC family toxin [Rhizobiaceae bacterium]|nr:type II toxin-antitoxin system VapC family toxin [Rhizobiaceae bacterium]
MFIDASVICAIILPEPDGDALLARMMAMEIKVSSPTAVWEATVAITRIRRLSLDQAHALVVDLFVSTGVRLNPVPPEAAALAIDAYRRFCKGRHPAGLNFGDCFAYACARHYKVPLLYNGGDFALTDVETA